MNELQAFIASKRDQMGFLTVEDMPALIELSRLFPVLVRCGGCRFTCAAQDLEHLIKCIRAGGDHLRDVSFPVGSYEQAAQWPCMSQEARRRQRNEVMAVAEHIRRANGDRQEHHGAQLSPDEGDYSGAFDGTRVISDADPGL